MTIGMVQSVTKQNQINFDNHNVEESISLIFMATVTNLIYNIPKSNFDTVCSHIKRVEWDVYLNKSSIQFNSIQSIFPEEHQWK